jgi:hypothetical protein
MSGWKDGRKKENKSRMSICLDGGPEKKGGGGVWHRVELLGTWQQQQAVLTGILIKGVGPGPTLAWPGWKQPDIPVEVDAGRLETDVGRQEF